MKVGFIAPGFSADERDWCIPALLGLVRGMARRHETHVFTLRYPHRRSTYSVHGATVHASGGADARDLMRLPMLGRTLLSIVKEHRRRPFDVFHGLWADEPGFLAVAASRLLRRPSVVSLLGGELVGFRDIGYGSQLSPVNRRMVAVALRSARAVLVGSRYLSRLAGPSVPPERLRLLPIGVDAARFRPNGRPSVGMGRGPNLLHVASLVPVKEQSVLLHAFSRIRASVPDARLHIVGGGPMRESLESLASSLGVRATFYGKVAHEILPDFYRAADLCLLSSRHEGQEWVTQEAAGCACATVGTAVGVVPDLAPATRAVEVGDASALAEVSVGILLNRDETIARGLEARVLFEERYTLASTVRSLQALYQELGEEEKRRAASSCSPPSREP